MKPCWLKNSRFWCGKVIVTPLRISKVGRYPKPFSMPSKRRLEKDHGTIWLMHFEGNEDSE